MKSVIVTLWVVLCLLPSMAFAQEYKLKPGDRVQINVWQDEKLNREVIVGPDGRVSLPLAGHIRAEGASLETLEARLKSRLQKFYSDALDITVLFVAERPLEQIEEDELTIIYVTGEVRNPGRFTVEEETTLLQAIALSGGLADFAAKKRVQVRRNVDGVETYLPFNYKEFEKGGNLDTNFLLQNGDVVIVPERGLFR